MTQQDAMNNIIQALKKALKVSSIEISADTDLLAEKVIDSLEGIVFIMELTELTGKEFPEDINLEKVGLFQVGNLVNFLTDTKSISDFLIPPSLRD